MPQLLLPLFRDGETHINAVMTYEKRDGFVYYFHACHPVFMHREDETHSFRMFTASMVVNGSCKQTDIVRAFGVPAISVKRAVKKFREEGAAAFYRRGSKRKPRVLTADVMKQAQELLNNGVARGGVADKLGIKPDTLRKAVAAGRLIETKKKSEPEEAPTKSERSVEDSSAGMGMGCTREFERVSAAVGGLSEAPTEFETSLDVPNGGVLWAIPALLENGLLRDVRDCFSLPPGFYSCEHIFLLLATMSLARIKTVEQLRYHPPGEWGKVLGLDRIPEVKTLRKKIKLLASPEAVDEWSSRLSQDWMKADPETAGVLYVDGHVRVYHGKQTKLPRRYVSRQRLCLRGTTDYWVNDQLGRPFFVLSTPFNPGLLATLKTEIIPRLLKEVPDQPSEEELEANPDLQRFTIVFDREGYSPEAFRDLWRQRIACQTYHKYPGDDWPESEFSEKTVTFPGGASVKMKLAERRVLLGKVISVREIRKLTESGHQVSVISTDYTSEMELIGVHMFSRWSQENFLKYVMQHFNLDGLIDHAIEPIDETTRVINPAWRTLDGEIRKKTAVAVRKKAKLGALSLEEGTDQSGPGEYEIRAGELKLEITSLENDLVELKAKRRETKKHIPLGQLPEEDRFAQLSPTRKRFVDTIKMIAYRAETAMAILLRDVLARSNDARSLLREIFTTEADLVVDEGAGTLTVRLHHLANRMSDEAARFLADHLNATETVYPGTKLRLIYELVSNPNPRGQDI